MRAWLCMGRSHLYSWMIQLLNMSVIYRFLKLHFLQKINLQTKNRISTFRMWLSFLKCWWENVLVNVLCLYFFNSICTTSVGWTKLRHEKMCKPVNLVHRQIRHFGSKQWIMIMRNMYSGSTKNKFVHKISTKISFHCLCCKQYTFLFSHFP